MKAPRPVADTEKTKNLNIPVAGDLSVDQMEAVLAELAEDLGLYLSHTTTLGAKRYPGNRHWHLKQKPKSPGCLDITYWPAGPLMWISMRNYEPAWVHQAGQELGVALSRHLQSAPARLGPNG